METSKDKAKILVEKYFFELTKKSNYKPVKEDQGKSFHAFERKAIECAKIAVDEIIEQWEYIDTYLSNMGGELNPNLSYWQEVKNELNKI